ncbi:hypothetical protein L207DRAFT_514139 [Hyaloscypha variabilis F]|uniref:Uncharacterized protein n=1 Tax=Hyaloscypha variabilis (strain UAMH 11265 / GT02V1 / F) TaxID=1149755 RepID=A0A2J6RI87_HYAVF|nr:hypothetical protein L207DRAFT_514139 [Hyaloscypha variabilis F]
MSVVDGNEQLLMALQELEIARYFISKSRFAVTESTVYRLWELPEHQDVEEDAHWPKDTIKALQNKTSHKKPTRHRSTTLDRHHSRRTKLALTHWQSTGEILYTMQAFSPQSEAGCALTLILHRQELAVLRRESRERASQRKSSVVRLGRCRCASDTCYEPESSSKESSPVPGVEISVEPPGTPTSAPPNGCFRAAVGAALSTISEERSRTTTPRLEQCISMNSVSDTTLFGLATPPDAPPSIDINGPPPQVVIAGGAPIGRITPPNDLSASPAAEVEPQHNFAVESSAVTGLQNGVQEAQGIDNEQPTSCATPPELPSIPPNVPEVMNVPDPIEQSASPKTQAVNPSQNGTMNCPTAEEIEVSKQTAEPEAIAEDLDGAAEGVQTKTSLLKKQERGDSGYGSMCPSQNEDGVKLDPKSGILKGDCCGLRPKMVYWFGLYRWTDTSDYTLLIMD